MLVVTLVVGGCGGSGRSENDGAGAAPALPLERVAAIPQLEVAPSVGARPVEVQVPAGFRMRRIDDAGAQIAVPRGWIALQRRDATFPGVAQTFLRLDGSLRPVLAALSVPDSPLKLLVLAPRSGGAFPATVSVVVSGSGRSPAAFAEWAPEVRRSLIEAAEPVGGRVRSGRVRLPLGDGLRMVFEQRRAGRRITVVQYAAMSGGQAYLVRLTTTPKRLASVIDDFDAIARTLVTRSGSQRAAPEQGTRLGPAA